MERVLRESDDGVVVYVAPSKALVNQVAAEAFARFSKEVAGQSLWAIHTGDYRINNPQNCQILVTVSGSGCFCGTTELTLACRCPTSSPRCC